jgi:hypothetical protein
MSLNTIVLLLIALANLVTAYLAFRTRQQMSVVVKQTNHLTEALVKTTGDAKFAEGVKSEKDNPTV